MVSRLGLSLVFVALLSFSLLAQKVSPYYNCGQIDGDVATAKAQAEELLKAKGYKVTGGYNVSGKSSLYVLTFTSKDVQRACLKVKDRGVLASNLRVGFQEIGNKTEISLLNPNYMFLGYLREGYTASQADLDKVNNEIKDLFKGMGGQLSEFGGSIDAKELKKYHYMAMMPYFDDPVELNTFSSFDEAIATIDKNLASKKGQLKKVYKQSYKSLEIAVYGIGMLDKEIGEPYFMNVIGEKHFVAMPYEIVVMGKEVSILPGKFRFALYWPELTMGTFTKIMSTPGDVEDMLKALTEK